MNSLDKLMSEVEQLLSYRSEDEGLVSIEDFMDLFLVHIFFNDIVYPMNNSKKYPFLNRVLDRIINDKKIKLNKYHLDHAFSNYTKGLSNLETIEILLKNGIDPNEGNCNGIDFLPLLCYCQHNYYGYPYVEYNPRNLADLFIRYGVKLDCRTFEMICHTKNFDEFEDRDQNYIDFLISKIRPNDLKSTFNGVQISEILSENFKNEFKSRFFNYHRDTIINLLIKTD